MKKILVICFDFDGTVIPDSEQCKQDAWRTLFPGEEGERLILEAHDRFGGGKGSRFDILGHILTARGVARSALDSEVKKVASDFDNAVQKGIIALGVPLETREALEGFSSLGYHLALNTATPTEAIKRTTDALGISRYFREILGFESYMGAPPKKVDNLKRLLETGLAPSPEDVLFVGDSDGDYKAAQDFGCYFVGFANALNQWDKVMKPFPVVRDLRRILDVTMS